MLSTESSRPMSGVDRIELLYEKQMFQLRSATDRIFVALMLCQWLGGTIMAIWLSPHTWIGNTPYVHLHVWAAVFLGGLITSIPIAMSVWMPGKPLTRHTIAIAQMLWSALLIHLSGGRIETHFHIFGSLAFLAFYRDWRVLVTATLVVATDHFVRGVFWPLSVFGVINESPFRWLEHAGWVVFEDVILVIACLRGQRETRELCTRQTLLELTNEKIEQQVHDRTSELQLANQKLNEEVFEREEAEARKARLGQILDGCINEVYVFDRESFRFIEVNQSAIDNLGYQEDEILKLTPLDLKPTVDRDSFNSMLQPLVDGLADFVPFECYHRRKDGSMYPVDVRVQLADWGSTPAFVALIVDISERREIEFDRDRAQEKLVDASHQAGMAEIATGVLHNVGNVLNSVNVSANLIGEKLVSSRVANLGRTAGLLESNVDNLSTFMGSDKGKMIPKYLSQLSQALVDEREQMLVEVKSLNENIDHIKEIVQTQQAHARMGGVVENIDLSVVVNDVIKMQASSIAQGQIEVVRDFSVDLNVVTDRHKLLQIIINLITNAINALRESDAKTGRLAVSIQQRDDTFVDIRVQDSGKGIAPQNLKKIFVHGFTTRKEGHGFGLHSSALAAAELGGSLTVQSDGLGYGALFTLTLPLEQSKKQGPVESAALPILTTTPLQTNADASL